MSVEILTQTWCKISQDVSGVYPTALYTNCCASRHFQWKKNFTNMTDWMFGKEIFKTSCVSFSDKIVRGMLLAVAVQRL